MPDNDDLLERRSTQGSQRVAGPDIPLQSIERRFSAVRDLVPGSERVSAMGDGVLVLSWHYYTEGDKDYAERLIRHREAIQKRIDAVAATSPSTVKAAAREVLK